MTSNIIRVTEQIIINNDVPKRNNTITKEKNLNVPYFNYYYYYN